MSAIRIQCSTFVGVIYFSPLHEATYIYNKTQDSPYDSTKLAAHSILSPEVDLISNCGDNCKTTVSLNHIVHFIDEENLIYSDFDCSVTFYPEALKKVKRVSRDGKIDSRSCENPKCTPCNDKHNCFIDEEHTSSIILGNYNLRDMDPAAPLSLNHTIHRDFLTMQHTRTSTNQPTNLCSVFFSLRSMDSEREGLGVRLLSFKKNYLLEGQVNETFATAEELLDCWKPNRWMEFLHL